MNSRPTVVIVCKFVHKFRLPFFEGLRSVLAADDIDLQLIYGKPDAAEQTKSNWAEPDWAIYCPNRFIRMRGAELQWQRGVLEHTRHADLVVVEQASKLLVNYPLMARSKVRAGQQIALWGHGKNIAASTSLLGEAIKRPMTLGADWFFAYTDSTRRLLIDAGYPEAQIAVVQNAVDTQLIGSEVAACSIADQVAWRDANGIPREAILGLALGSLYADKRPNFLVEVSDAAYAADSRVHTVIAGGGPEAKSMHAAASTRPWLHMVGPVFGDDKVAALSTSTCMVMPGVGGLVIVDAFAAGLPLVIAENPHHPPEFDYVKADHNGVVLPSDVSADSFGREVAALVADRDRLAVLAEGSAADGALYTMEAMVERFACGVRRALKER